MGCLAGDDTLVFVVNDEDGVLGEKVLEFRPFVAVDVTGVVVSEFARLPPLDFAESFSKRFATLGCTAGAETGGGGATSA